VPIIIKQTVAPAYEPITLVEAKAHLRVTFTDDDTLIGDMIGDAREKLENDTWRQYMPATWRLTLDCFPGAEFYRQASIGYGRGVRDYERVFDRDVIRVPRPPLASLVSIQYLDTAGTLQTLDPSAYVVDGDDEPARIAPSNGNCWPVTLDQIGAVTISYTAGYSLAAAIQSDQQAAVPKMAKRAIKLLLGHWYEHREIFASGRLMELPQVYESLAWSLRAPWIV
jgi:uncharacterized phiE125 gp8 family phage protein